MTSLPALPSLRQLRVFQAIAENGSIRQAAIAVHMSQPAASQALQKLEQSLGVSLLTRSTGGAFLTREGEILLRRVNRFSEHIAAVARLDGGVVWHLTLSQIRSLMAVARAGSFVAAAQALGISEPALQRAARDAERILRRPLYQRGPDGVSVTRQGAETARGFGLALREIENGLEEIAGLSGSRHAELRVGALPLVRTLLLARGAREITTAHPEARLRVFDGSYTGLVQALRAGEIDFLIGALRNPAPFDDLTEETLFVDRFAFVTRAGHPLTKLATITPQDIARYGLIAAIEGTPIRSALTAYFAAHGLDPQIQVETGSLVAIRAFLMESDQVTLLSRHQIRFEEAAGMLVTLPVDLPQTARPVGLTLRRNWLPTDLQQNFVAALRAAARDL